MPPTLTTKRLILQPMTLDDATDLFQIYRHPDAMAFMPWPPHRSVKETQAYIAQALAQTDAHYWIIRLKDQDQGIGLINYLGGSRIPGVGYILHPDFWGQGFTVEACRAALDYGFSALHYDRVELWIDETNVRSLRVAQKLGFSVKGRIAHKYSHKRHNHFMLVWGVLAVAWQDNSGTPVHDSSTTRFFAVEPVLPVHDVRAAAEFYRDRLGFGIDFLFGDPEDPDHGGVSRGEWTGSLVAIQLSRVPADHAITPAGYLHIRIDTSLDALCARYRANGVTIIAEPEDKPWGYREFAIRDLSGHVLVFAALL